MGKNTMLKYKWNENDQPKEGWIQRLQMMWLASPNGVPNEMMDGVPEDLPPDLELGITEILDRLRCNLVASDEWKCNVPEVFCWI